ncbi:MAG: hypothetical protein F7C35_01705 [Desulfurococcales archaeon]|nr:hypothetical protein [Desulfurococcales archaeon]
MTDNPGEQLAIVFLLVFVIAQTSSGIQLASARGYPVYSIKYNDIYLIIFDNLTGNIPSLAAIPSIVSNSTSIVIELRKAHDVDIGNLTIDLSRVELPNSTMENPTILKIRIVISQSRNVSIGRVEILNEGPVFILPIFVVNSRNITLDQTYPHCGNGDLPGGSSRESPCPCWGLERILVENSASVTLENIVLCHSVLSQISVSQSWGVLLHNVTGTFTSIYRSTASLETIRSKEVSIKYSTSPDWGPVSVSGAHVWGELEAVGSPIKITPIPENIGGADNYTTVISSLSIIASPKVEVNGALITGSASIDAPFILISNSTILGGLRILSEYTSQYVLIENSSIKKLAGSPGNVIEVLRGSEPIYGALNLSMIISNSQIMGGGETSTAVSLSYPFIGESRIIITSSDISNVSTVASMSGSIMGSKVSLDLYGNEIYNIHRILYSDLSPRNNQISLKDHTLEVTLASNNITVTPSPNMSALFEQHSFSIVNVTLQLNRIQCRNWEAGRTLALAYSTYLIGTPETNGTPRLVFGRVAAYGNSFLGCRVKVFIDDIIPPVYEPVLDGPVGLSYNGNMIDTAGNYYSSAEDILYDGNGDGISENPVTLGAWTDEKPLAHPPEYYKYVGHEVFWLIENSSSVGFWKDGWPLAFTLGTFNSTVLNTTCNECNIKLTSVNIGPSLVEGMYPKLYILRMTNYVETISGMNDMVEVSFIYGSGLGGATQKINIFIDTSSPGIANPEIVPSQVLVYENTSISVKNIHVNGFFIDSRSPVIYVSVVASIGDMTCLNSYATLESLPRLYGEIDTNITLDRCLNDMLFNNSVLITILILDSAGNLFTIWNSIPVIHTYVNLPASGITQGNTTNTTTIILPNTTQTATNTSHPMESTNSSVHAPETTSPATPPKSREGYLAKTVVSWLALGGSALLILFLYWWKRGRS